MFSISINHGPAGTVWNLLFKTEEGAKAVYNTYVSARMEAILPATAPIIGADDFGQAYALPLDQINSMMFEDLDLSQQGQIERGLHNARTQAKAQQRAMGDATLRTAAMAQGPAVLSGGMPNGRFNG